jgi:hypothetical protein
MGSRRKVRHTRSLSPSSKISRQAHGYFSDGAADAGDEVSDEEKTLPGSFSASVEGSFVPIYTDMDSQPVGRASGVLVPFVL